MRCVECIFWKRYSPEATIMGHCMRYPPRPTPIEDVTGVTRVEDIRPSTAANDFCGEFKDRIGK